MRRPLFPILETSTASRSAYFHPGLSAIIGGDGAVLLKAPLNAIETVCAVAKERWHADSPEYVWPEDRSWVLCADHDLVSTYLAGSEELAVAVLAEKHLESIPVSLDTRVDDRADSNR